MKKSIFLLIALLAGALNLFADDECTSVPTSAVGTATITFVRYVNTEVPGEFSVADGRKVRFAHGNLQYHASTRKWRFAEEQYEALGVSGYTHSGTTYTSGNETAANRSNQELWIDLFGWGCSGYNNGQTAYQPWSTSTTDTEYYSTHVAGTQSDWAYHNVIINGATDKSETSAGMWRVLTKDEWDYLFNARDHADELYGLGELMGVRGLFIIPDNWWGNWDEKVSPSRRDSAGFTWTAASKSFKKNIIPDNAAGHKLWDAMETSGAVFLPVDGYRRGTTVTNGKSYGFYWNATSKSTTEAYVLRFYEGNFKQGHGVIKSDGRSVRPVMDIAE